jgi:type IV pilus assembly protein PilC
VAVFKYTAISPDGQQIKSSIEGVSVSSAENDLLRQNLQVVKIKEKKAFSQLEVSAERVPRQEIMHFSRQVAAFVRTGIPIIEAVRVVEDGTGNKRFRAILGDVREQLQSGVPFSESLAPHRDIFPPYYLGILRSAEMTGQLDTVLDQLSVYIERDLEARSTIKSALTYPLVILVMSVVTMVIMVGFVLPKFVDFFKDMDSNLPLPTRMLLGLSDGFQTWWWLLFLMTAAFIVTYILLGRSAGGRRVKHRAFLRIPVVGEVVRYAAIERFCRIIAAMMRSGVPLPEAMSSAIESTNNQIFEDGLRLARDEMIEGDGMAGPLERTDLFPPAAIQMIRVGEETGTLDQQMEASATYYSRELEFKLKRLTTLFEPAVIIFMGLIVGFVAVALISAMYGVLEGQKEDL